LKGDPIYMAKRALVSCFQCVGMAGCYGQNNSALIDIDRQEARDRCATCTKLERGMSTDVVKVVGRERGMSRKKAQRLIDQGEAKWAEYNLVELFNK